VKVKVLNRISSLRYSHNQPTIGIVIFVVLLIIYAIKTNNFFSMFQIRDIILNSALAIALAATGGGIVIISGGLDLTVGSAVALVNVILVTTYGMFGGIIVWSLICIVIGLLIGFFNGMCVAVFRLPPIIATLANMFILQGIALLIMPQPTGKVPIQYMKFLTGAVGNIIPFSLICFLLLFVALFVLKNSSFGMNLYAIGSNEYASYLNGIKVERVKLSAYTLAGLFYALSGLYLTALRGSGDPTQGAPFLLSTLATIVVGGIRIGGGKGSIFGSIIGAGIMNMAITTLFVLGVSSYWGPIANGIILIGAVIITDLWDRVQTM